MTDSSIIQVGIPQMSTVYIDPTPVCDPSVTEWDDFLPGEGNPCISIIDLKAKELPESPDFVHDMPAYKIDLESVADQISSDTIWPDMQVTAADLSTAQYYDTSVNLR